MDVVNMHDAKSNLSKLVKRAADSEDILIANNGQPVAMLTRLPRKPRKMPWGMINFPEFIPSNNNNCATARLPMRARFMVSLGRFEDLGIPVFLPRRKNLSVTVRFERNREVNSRRRHPGQHIFRRQFVSARLKYGEWASIKVGSRTRLVWIG